VTPAPERVAVVTGLGVVSPVGCGAGALWQALLMGRSGVRPVRSFDTGAYASHLGAEVDDRDGRFTPHPGGPGRSTLLAAAAGRQALLAAGLSEDDLADTALCIGTTMGEACWLEAWPREAVATTPASLPADELLRSGPDQVALDTAALVGLGGNVSAVAGACAAGNYALAEAADLIRLERAERVLAGGADAFSRTAFTGFSRIGALSATGCRPYGAGRDGIVLGEGAAMLVVESLASARRRGARVLATIVGSGLACDAHHIVSPEPEGKGLRRALEAALDDAAVRTGAVDWICGHGTGTPANDLAEINALRAVFAGPDPPPLSSIKALTGHGLGGASAIEAVACVLALQQQIVPPTWNTGAPDPECAWDIVADGPRRARLGVVVNAASAFGGNNAAVVLAHPDLAGAA